MLINVCGAHERLGKSARSASTELLWRVQSVYAMPKTDKRGDCCRGTRRPDIMMGHINNLLIQLVEKSLGAERVGQLFTLAGIPRERYQPEVVYSEEEFQALYRAAKEMFGVDDEAAQKAFSGDVSKHLQVRG
jgi:hypothetical protein